MNFYCYDNNHLLSGAWVKSLSTVIGQILQHHVRIPLTIDGLNGDYRIAPEVTTSNNDPNLEEYQCFGDLGLKWGILQLAESTGVIIDETTLESGKLNEKGVRNYSRLYSAVNDATLHYNFEYCSTPIPINYKFLVVSQRLTILKVKFKVPISIKNAQYTATPIGQREIHWLRHAVMLAEVSDFVIKPDMVDFISKQYADRREKASRRNEPLTTELELLGELDIARLIALSNKRTYLNLDDWNSATSLEKERLDRVNNTPTCSQTLSK